MSKATGEGKMPKLRWHCARVEVDERYKVTSGGAHTYPAANNQAQICVLRCHFSCRDRLCQIILVSGSLTQLGEHRNGNPRVVGSSPTWDWLHISNQKALAQHWISYICTYIYNKSIRQEYGQEYNTYIAMDGQWQSSRIARVTTNRVLNKH